MFKRVFAILAVIGVSACSTVPDPIVVADEVALVNYNGALLSSDETVGKMARWGGVITQVENKPNQTIIEVVNFPLNSYGKPMTSKETVGRFKAVIDAFVDPITLEEGRLITFIGKVKEPLAGLVGEHPYKFPAIAVENFHLWRKQSNYTVSGMYMNFYGGWFSPFYYPHWYHHFYPYYRVYYRAPRPTPNLNSGNIQGSNRGFSRMQKHNDTRMRKGNSSRSAPRRHEP